jgi:hypothetical protein
LLTDARSTEQVAGFVRANARDVEMLANRCGLAVRALARLVQDRRVDIAQTGTYGWGQYLDEPHHSDTQWGRFGSSAALQVLAIEHRRGRPQVDFNPLQMHGVSPELFPDSLPALAADATRTPPSEPGHSTDPWKERDFAKPMKVAFCVDAVCPHIEDEVPGPAPALVERLIALALPDGYGWGTRPPDDRHHQIYDRQLVTAFALYALRRFPQQHEHGRIDGVWSWLAQEVLDYRDSVGEDVLGLCGLALGHAAPRPARLPVVADALRCCKEHLTNWARARASPIIDRPWFNGYSEGATTNYMFLSPEVLTAIFFLGRDSPESTRSYVVEVVRGVVDNILGGEGTPRHEGPRGFRIQRSMEGTVDQMWAARLLWAFMSRHATQPATLVPPQPSLSVPVRTVAPNLPRASDGARYPTAHEDALDPLVARSSDGTPSVSLSSQRQSIPTPGRPASSPSRRRAGLLMTMVIATVLAIVAFVVLSEHGHSNLDSALGAVGTWLAAAVLGALLAVVATYTFKDSGNDP